MDQKSESGFFESLRSHVKKTITDPSTLNKEEEREHLPMGIGVGVQSLRTIRFQIICFITDTFCTPILKFLNTKHP